MELRDTVLRQLKNRREGFSLEQPFYTDQDYFKLDMETIWYRDWLFVGHDCEVPKSGNYFTVQVGSYSVVIVRGRDGVHFAGRLTYPQTLARIAAADALVQTSIGFETQGMTPFEAATLGTPSVICDPDIAAELGGGLWAVPDAAGEDRRTAALAETLRRAASDIADGTAPTPLPGVAEAFRQSSRTAAMVEVYERMRAGG